MFEVMVDLEYEELEINWLMYKSYEAQRDNAPNVEVERWKKIYINQPDYEKVYQATHSVHKGFRSVHKDFDSVHNEI